MNHQTNLQVAQASDAWAIGQTHNKARHLGTRIAEIFGICANAWATAIMYEKLSKLSDAELERRGIPRGELHRWVFEALTKDT